MMHFGTLDEALFGVWSLPVTIMNNNVLLTVSSDGLRQSRSSDLQHGKLQFYLSHIGRTSNDAYTHWAQKMDARHAQ